MRLICPNCGAQYEVADDAIPDEGRDVQCSSCSHIWFETPGSSEAREAGETPPSPAPEEVQPQQVAPSDPPVQSTDEAPSTSPQPDVPPQVETPEPARETQQIDQENQGFSGTTTPADEPITNPSISDTPTVEPTVETRSQQVAEDLTEAVQHDVQDGGAESSSKERSSVSPTVAEILREEAARENTKRLVETEGNSVETQPDLGLVQALDRDEQMAEEARRRMSRIKGEAAPAIGAATAVAAGSRSDLLPDIDEINSSLRSSTDRIEEEQSKPEVIEKKRKSGFRRAFFFILLLAVLALLVYIFAPQISNAVPSLKPSLDSYVDLVDRGRIWLDMKLQGLLAGSDR